VVELLVIALSIFAFALVSEKLSMSPVTAPMFFTTVGLVLGHGGLGWFNIEVEDETVSILVEATLVLVLFTDAIRINLRQLRRGSAFPMRLLGIGLPLSFIFGTVVAHWMLPSFSWAEAALLSAILSPTDAALGQAVVSDLRLPVRLRQGLNVESGLNDGVIVPVVTVTLAIAAADLGTGGLDVSGFVMRQIGFGILVGIVFGAAGGWVLHYRAVGGHIEGVFRQLATIAIAAGAFACANLVDGNGFIAAFLAGISFGAVAREQCDGIQDFTEDEGELLNLITFTVFGAVLAGPALSELTWEIAAYAALSLTAIRMLPVLVALWRSGTLMETRLFAGWFGPRGLASILFALLVLQELESPQTETIFVAATWTVLLSIYLHGLTANVWVGHLAQRFVGAPDSQAEMAEVPEMPTRRGFTAADFGDE
jgi:NhaP-type Na+/H+ or K+/H+ antiporter